MELNSLKYNFKSRGHKTKTYGRGKGSGIGGTSTRGNNGQHQRKSGNTRLGFEGGQTPIYRRLPKVGFLNVNRVRYEVLTLEQLSQIATEVTIDLHLLKDLRYVPASATMFKIIGNNSLTKAYNVVCDKISKNSQDQIEKAGGSVTLVSSNKKPNRKVNK